MSEQNVIGKGTWIDKLASELIEREKQLGRDTSLIRVESGLGASGIPHIGSLGDAVRAYGVKIALENINNHHQELSWLVLELSSYQIEGSPKVAPTIGIWTTFTPDHLERHNDIETYFKI